VPISSIYRDCNTLASRADIEEYFMADEQKLWVAVADRSAVSMVVIDKYTKWSFGIGFVPISVVDLVGLTVIQMRMLEQVAKVYGQSFGENKLRCIVSSLIGGAFPQSVNHVGMSSLLKNIPILGTLVSLVVMPVACSAATYALGAVFVKHFESGGTLLNIDLQSMTADVTDIAAQYRQDKEKKTDG
jgi:uncharacterized protein (DUF697 family)